MITLIGLAIIVVGLFSFFPNIEKMLEDRLKNSLSRGSKDHGPLGQIFYKYNHKDSRAWTEWALKQDAETQNEAINKLKTHIDQSPSNWGSITPEAIIALSRFENEDHLQIFRNILVASRKMWKKYMISGSCYEAALEGVIHINENSAIEIIQHEIEKSHEGENSEEQTISIINALKEFSEDKDLKNIFIQILTDTNQSLRARTYAINVAEEKDEEKAQEIFAESIDEILKTDGTLSSDDQRVMESLLNLATKEINDKSFELLMKALINSKSTYTTFKVLDLVLKGNHSKFTPEQLYMLTHTQEDEQEIVTGMMANIFTLNSEEKILCRYQHPLKQYPFKKAPVNNETVVKAMQIPEGYEDLYSNLKELTRERANEKQQGTSGGIVLTGYSDEEKLYLCRTLASEKKYHFIYASFEDVLGSSSTAKTLHDLVATHKPCLVYFDDVDSIFKNLDPNFIKTFKNFFTDPLINVIGTLREEAEISSNRQCVLFSREDLKDLFPIAIEVSYLTDAFKNTFLANKLAVLDASRGGQTYESLNILEPTKEMGLFDFRKYLAAYFKASLVVHGKLISSHDFEKLDALDFEGKVER